jgi:menaquinone-dependent protoporphyrinogen IX oxidase
LKSIPRSAFCVNTVNRVNQWQSTRFTIGVAPRRGPRSEVIVIIRVVFVEEEKFDHRLDSVLTVVRISLKSIPRSAFCVNTVNRVNQWQSTRFTIGVAPRRGSRSEVIVIIRVVFVEESKFAHRLDSVLTVVRISLKSIPRSAFCVNTVNRVNQWQSTRFTTSQFQSRHFLNMWLSRRHLGEQGFPLCHDHRGSRYSSGDQSPAKVD